MAVKPSGGLAVLEKIREAWRAKKTKIEHERYLEEHKIHPVKRLREHSEKVNPELSKQLWAEIEELHRKNIGAFWYRPSEEDKKRIEAVARALHEKVMPRVDEQEWIAIITGLQRYEEPYKTLGKCWKC